LRVHIAVVYDA